MLQIKGTHCGILPWTTIILPRTNLISLHLIFRLWTLRRAKRLCSKKSKWLKKSISLCIILSNKIRKYQLVIWKIRINQKEIRFQRSQLMIQAFHLNTLKWMQTSNQFLKLTWIPNMLKVKLMKLHNLQKRRSLAFIESQLPIYPLLSKKGNLRFSSKKWALWNSLRNVGYTVYAPLSFRWFCL